MSGTLITSAAGGVSLSGSNVTFVIVALVFALIALAFAAMFVQSVLKTGRGTKNMQEIAGAVQEGASAYLFRQFRTLAIFVVIAVVLLFLLPWLSLNASVSRHVHTLVNAGFTIALFWALWRLVEVWRVF